MFKWSPEDTPESLYKGSTGFSRVINICGRYSTKTSTSWLLYIQTLRELYRESGGEEMWKGGYEFHQSRFKTRLL